ncbi:MAG: hypothetical protein ABJ239_03575 [Erythrobacter sp.]
MSLLAYEEVDHSTKPETAAFSDRETHEIVIAGGALGLLYSLPPEAIEAPDQPKIAMREEPLRPGSTISLAGARESREITNVRGTLLVLQLSRAAKNPRPVQEIRIADGALVHQASGDTRESQISMAMAVLTEMARADASPVLAELSNEGPAYLRWDALRHTLALDPVGGFALLRPMANNTQDELAEPARALREQLEKAHPQLLQLEAELCPA